MGKPSAAVTVIYGDTPDTMTRQLLHVINPASSFPRDASIILKPNLVVAKPSSSGATTAPAVVEAVIRYLRDHSFTRVSIMESSWIGCCTKRAYKECGYERLSKTYGVKLVDLKDDPTVSYRRNGRDYVVCRSVAEADILINMPVLKGHCQTRMTGALKNLKGCIPDSEKRRYHTLGLHEPIAQLNTIIKPAWTLMDAICGDLGFEEGGTPSSMHRIMASQDPVLLDSYACTLLGLEPRQIGYLERAAELGIGRLYDPSGTGTVRELNTPESAPQSDSSMRDITRLADERSACSACSAALAGALNRMDDREYKEILKLQDDADSPLFALGQDFTEAADPYTGHTLGIGTCCALGFSSSVPGCPPTQDAIMEAVRKLLQADSKADASRY